MPTLIGWLIFTSGFLISGVLNHDPELYKIIKYFLLFLVFSVLIIIDNTPDLLNKCLNFSLYIVMIPLLCLIILRKNDLLVILGDGRIGWLFAFPGTLWKVGACVWPHTVWKYLNQLQYKNLLSCELALFCMVLDGSRTAIVWIFLTTVIVGVFYFIQKSYKNISYKPICYLLSIILFTYFIIQPMILSWVLGCNSSNTATCYRLVNGETNIRLKMLETAWKQVIEKFPWGGGFNSTRVLEEGEYSTIHMTYLQLLCDGGVVTLIGYLLFILYPFFILLKFFTEKIEYFFKRFEVMLSSVSVIGLTLLIGLFHPVSNELNEWGVVFLAISVSMTYIARSQYAFTSS